MRADPTLASCAASLPDPCRSRHPAESGCRTRSACRKAGNARHGTEVEIACFILLDDADLSPTGFNPLGSVITPNLFPGVSISSDLGNGPGIQEVATFSVDVEGPNGSVAVANAHGTVTGAAGGVLLRPFARLISKAGDSVTTYGEPWNMN